jgi:hypothetical protein
MTTMSTNDKAAVASGADVGDALRKRNVPGAQPVPAQVQVQPEDKKKTLKKVRISIARASRRFQAVDIDVPVLSTKLSR